jgi:hypothetical protein
MYIVSFFTDERKNNDGYPLSIHATLESAKECLREIEKKWQTVVKEEPVAPEAEWTMPVMDKERYINWEFFKGQHVTSITYEGAVYSIFSFLD